MFEVKFSDVIITKVGTERLPDSCLPFGTIQEDHNTKVNVHCAKKRIHLLFRDCSVWSFYEPGYAPFLSARCHSQVVTIKPSKDLKHCMLAVSNVNAVSQAVIKEAVQGFVVVNHVRHSLAVRGTRETREDLFCNCWLRIGNHEKLYCRWTRNWKSFNSSALSLPFHQTFSLWPLSNSWMITLQPSHSC